MKKLLLIVLLCLMSLVYTVDFARAEEGQEIDCPEIQLESGFEFFDEIELSEDVVSELEDITEESGSENDELVMELYLDDLEYEGETLEKSSKAIKSNAVEMEGIIYEIADGYAEVVGISGDVEDVVIKSVVDGYAVKKIKSRAMESSLIKSLTIPASVDTLGFCSFSRCKQLKTVIIQGSLTSLDTSCFSWCTSLTDVSFQGENVYISNDMFSGCSSLKNVTFMGHLNSIGVRSFEDCQALETIELPDGIITIDSYAFYGCTSLSSINIPTTVKNFGDAVFQKCPSLRTITGPICIALKGRTYQDSPLLTSATLYSDGSTVLGNAFTGTPIKEVTVIGDIPRINAYAFANDTSLETITFTGGIGEIGVEAFAGCHLLKSINLPENLTVIDNHAFDDCRSLTEITIPNSVVKVGVCIFQNCIALENVVCPVLMTHSSRGFAGTAVKNLTIYGDGQTAISNGLQFVTTLEQVKIIGGTTYIVNGAFDGCTALREINIPEGCTSIGLGAFANCSSLKAITFPSTLTLIGEVAFHGAGVVDVTIPAHVSLISRDAFKQCRDLEKVVILEDESHVEMSIREDAFLDCFKLTDITIPPRVTNISSGSIGILRTETPEGYYEDEVKTNENCVIHGQRGSYAEAYALSWGITFDDGTIKPSSISITNGEYITLKVGETLDLKVVLIPDDAETTLNWDSGNENIATVSDRGKVKGISIGSTSITVKTANDLSATVNVKVVAPEPSGIIISQGKKATLYIGNKLTLKTKLKPKIAETTLTWKSSSPNVVAVSKKGVVTPKKAGTAVITVKTANGKSAKITIKVVDASKVQLKRGDSTLKTGQVLNLKRGKSLTLKAVVSPAKVKTKLKWSCSDKTVGVTVKNGRVTAEKTAKAGAKVKISVKTANGVSTYVYVMVK